MSTNDAAAGPSDDLTLNLSVKIPRERHDEFKRLVAQFLVGATPAAPPAFEFRADDYPSTMRALVRDPATSFALKKRLLDDDARDPVDALHDAETLHAVQSKRFTEGTKAGSVQTLSAEADATVAQGVEALQRLYDVACGHSGQCRFIARFLLGLYNGDRFPFDLTDLRCIDDELYEDCIRVLNMDARLTRREVHTYFEDGGRKWEALADQWCVVDMRLLRLSAKSFAEQVGFSGDHGSAAAELLNLIEGKRLSS